MQTSEPDVAGVSQRRHFLRHSRRASRVQEPQRKLAQVILPQREHTAVGELHHGKITAGAENKVSSVSRIQQLVGPTS